MNLKSIFFYIYLKYMNKKTLTKRKLPAKEGMDTGDVRKGL